MSFLILVCLSCSLVSLQGNFCQSLSALTVFFFTFFLPDSLLPSRTSFGSASLTGGELSSINFYRLPISFTLCLYVHVSSSFSLFLSSPFLCVVLWVLLVLLILFVYFSCLLLYVFQLLFSFLSCSSSEYFFPRSCSKTIEYMKERLCFFTV